MNIRNSDQSSQTDEGYGGLYILSFSGFVIIDNNAPLSSVVFKRNGLTFEFDPPRRLAPPTWRPIPQFNEQSFKQFFPNAPFESPPLMRMAVLPAIDENNKPALQSIWGDEPQKNLPADTYCMFIYGKKHSSLGIEIATEVLENTFQWLRTKTQQWWIGRPTEGITGNMHYYIPLAERRHSKEPPIIQAKNTSPILGTRKVDSVLWHQAVTDASHDKKPDADDVLFSDAMYYYFAGDHRISIIVLCSCFEICRDLILEVRGISKRRLPKSSTDLIAHVTGGFGDLFNRNLEKEDHEAYNFLKSVWIARGNVAHGKTIHWRENNKNIPFSNVGQKTFVEGAHKIHSWLKSLKNIN